MNLLRNVLKWYDQKLYAAPYMTQMVTNGPLWAVGDLSAQWLENTRRKRKEPIDWLRTARFSVYGFCVAGPLFAWWYGFIERRWMHLRLQGEWTKYLVAKIGCDQLLFEPPYLLQFFGTMGALKGDSPSDIKKLVEDEYVTTFAIDTAVWPIAQAINFRYVPSRFQAIYVNFISIGWAGFLSLVSNPSKNPEEPVVPKRHTPKNDYVAKPAKH